MENMEISETFLFVSFQDFVFHLSNLSESIFQVLFIDSLKVNKNYYWNININFLI